MLQSAVQVLVNGITDGMVLFLVAVGLTVIFGVLKVLNFAHGSFYMLGAYYTYFLVNYFDGQFWLSVVLAALLVAVTGGVIERFIFRRIYDHDHIFQLLLTFALVLVIDNTARVLWGGQFRSVSTPELLQFQVFQGFPAYRMFLLAVGLLLAVSVWLVFERTLIGKKARAAAENNEIAHSIGINVRLLYTAIFIGGSALAGLAGAISAPYVSIFPEMGEYIIIDSFIVVIIGGLGSFAGALVGALLIGVLGAIAFAVAPATEPIVPFVLMAVILLVRPAGIFGEVEQ